MMGDLFVKTDLSSNQIYPMFWTYSALDITEWNIKE